MKKINLIEWLWKTDSHEKQKPQRFARYAAILIMLLTLGVGQMWGGVSGGYIYFDVSTSGWSNPSSVEYIISHDNYSCWYAMSNVSNTKLYYISSASWSDAKYIAFTGNYGWTSCEGNSYDSRKGYGSGYRTSKNSYGVNSGSTYLFYAASADADAEITTSSPAGYLSAGYSALNATQTIQSWVSTNGAAYSNAKSKAKIDLTSYAMNGNGSSAKQTGSITTSQKSGTISAARTATTTLSVGTVADGYVFMGWYDTSGNNLDNGTSYTYYPTGSNTVCARFATKYTVGKKLYLKVSSDWKGDGARFAACFGAASGQTWVNCTQVGTSDYYYVEVPSGSWGYVIFCRMDGSKAANNWNNKWNQTDDMLASNTTNGAEITGWDNSQNWITVYDGLSVAKNIDAAADAPDITNSQTATKATTSITVNAQTANTGYDWVNWTSSGSGTFGTATNRSTTFTPAASNEVATANYAEKTYSLNFSHNGHGSIAVGGNTIASGSTASVNYHTTKTLVATNNTGYHFTGWTLSGTNTNKVTIENTTSSGASTSIKATATGATVTAGFEANTYTITLDDDGDYGGNGSATATYNESTLSISSNPTRDDYRINGFYAPGTGDLIADASGNLQASKNANTGSGDFAVTDANGKWIYDGNLTLYAHWTYDVTEYEVNFGVESGSSSFGSLTAYDNNTSSYISTGSDVRSGHGLTFTASPNTGYEVEGWYTDAACTSGKHDEGETTYSIASLSGAADVYVKFKEIEWSVAFAAGTGGTVTTPNSTPRTVGQLTGISIAATPSSGYTFNTWTITSGSGSFTSAATTNSNTFKPTAASTVTASFTETMRTITINGGTAASTTAGVATTGSATAAAPAAGKKFTGWTLGDGVALSGGALTDRTINFTATQASSVTANYADRASVKMYFAKPTNLSWSKVYAYAWGPSGENKTYPGVELSTTEVINCVTYYIYQYYTEEDGIGGAATGDATWNKIVFGDNNDARKTGDLIIADGHYYYRATEENTSGKSSAITAAWYIKGTMNSWDESAPITHDCVNNKGTVSINLTGGNNYEFKVYNEVNNQMWSNSTACGSSNPISASMASAQTLYNDDENVMQVNTALTGDYIFEVSSTNASNPKVKVTFPEIYAIAGSFNSWSSTANPLVMDGNTGTVSIALAPNDYTFKVVDNGSMYGKNSTTVTGTTTINDVVIGENDMTLKADIYASSNPSYTFSYDKSGKDLTITYPSGHAVNYGVGDHAGTDAVTMSPNIVSGKKILDSQSLTFSKGSTATGYTWKGWYSSADGTGTLHSSTDGDYTKSSRSGDFSVYACYNLVNYTITYNLNGGSNPGGAPTGFTIESSAVTLPTPAKTGYTFIGWYTESTFVNKVTTIAAGSTGNKEYWAKWTPKNYTITLNQNGATTESDPTSLTATYDATAPVYDAGASAYKYTITNPEKTGYTFAGWFENEGGAGAEIITTYGFFKHEDNPYVDGTGHWKNAGDVTVYAKWTPNNYAVTLSTSGETGYGSSAPSNQTATYGAGLPTITPPVGAAGYKFQGYYTEANGAGMKYYNADGTSAKNWDIASATTLYAYFQKAEITALTHASSLAKAATTYLVVNPTIAPAGASNYMDICWTLHYAENDNEVATSGTSYYSVGEYADVGKPNQVRFTLTNLAVGSYYVKAVLKASASSGFSPCSTGTELNTITGEFSIVGSSTVTIQYKNLSTGDVIASSGLVEISAGGNAGIKAPNIIGYTFNSWSLGAGVTNTCADGASCGTGKDSINISSPYDGVITAFYTKKNMIYFNNTLGWDTVYVYFYSSNKYWDDNKGTGAQWDKSLNSAQAHYYHMWGGMTRIGSSNIYYLDYEDSITNASWQAEVRNYTNVAFTKDAQGYRNAENKGYEFFYSTEVVRRGDFAHSKSMFVPLTEPNRMLNGETTKYYDEGYWMNYPDNSGYTLVIYDYKDGAAPITKQMAIPFAANKTMPMSITTDLEGSKTYSFEIKRADGNYYGNANTMSNGHSGDGAQTVWEFTHNAGRAGLTTTSAGNYTFTLNYGQDASRNYNYLVGVRYPESTGDFRVQYKDAVRVTNHGGNEAKSWLNSVVIPAVTEADTVSYFVRKDETPYIRVQKCTATWDGSATTVTWDNENSGNNIISSLPSAITEDGVYNFIFKKVDGALTLDKVEPYTGNFYIRTDGAGSTKWDNYRAADHIMPFSEYSFAQTNDPYSHYFTHFYRTKTDKGEAMDPLNIKFVVANDYSTNISDTIARDSIGDNYVDGEGWLSGRNANIRFMYNYKTNVATRRYLDGAQGPGSDDFLLLIPSNSSSIYASEDAVSGENQVKFSDNGNWIYEANVWVVPGTTYKLKSQFGVEPNLVTQYLKGAESGASEFETLIGGSGSRLKIRLLYDFKTNRVIAAYVPSNGDEISGNNAINADIMFERVHQGNVTQITFATNESKISKIKNVYSTLKFEKDEINNPLLSRYARDLFYVSFPYDVLVSDIIGFGTYGKHWIIEYYDGADRAEKGFWKDSKSFWKFVTPAMASSYTLKAGTGYIVALDLDEMEDGDEVWENTSTVELIFPGDISSISNQEVTYTMPSHQCNIGPRFDGGDDRRIADSHWNVLGVPAYHNTTGTFANHTDEIGNKSQVWSAGGKPNYLYTWNMTDNSLSVTNASGYNYKAMHAYVVQYYGDVTFHTSTNAVPASVVARRNENAPRDVEFRLEIQQNETAVDQAFVKLSNEEGVSSEFVFGEDLSKEFNKNKANIYTMVTSILEGDATVTETAGNTLPLSEQTTVVPVGVKIATTGDYTFAIPDGTSGVGVTLVDLETGVRTNLALFGYNINLEAGEYNERFLLEISPIQPISQGIDEVNGEGLEANGVRKVLIDNVLYIIRDGKVFDAQGKRLH